MNFLPFVFTFLLLLTLISSFLFSSVMGTARASKVILSQHQAYLKLISMQNEKLFTKKTGPKDKPKGPRQHHPPGPSDPEPRSVNEGLEKGKLNLFALIHGNNPQVKQVLEQTALRLLDILYGKYDFYNKALLKNILVEMIEQKIESFEELKLKDDRTYYKILKGTNTGYPALGEYFRIYKKDVKPIYFRYATKPVLRAALGDALAQTIFESERKAWLQDKSRKVMIKKDVEALLKQSHSSLLPHNLINEMVDFNNKSKGSPQIHQEGKIRALHAVEESL